MDDFAILPTMMVQFDSKVGGFGMFGDSAVQLLKMMGHSGTVPSAILAADIPQALAQLESALAAYREPPPDPEAERQGDARVPLRQRAYPLIDLLRRAAEHQADVMWR
jgi:hypothetical protein